MRRWLVGVIGMAVLAGGAVTSVEAQRVRVGVAVRTPHVSGRVVYQNRPYRDEYRRVQRYPRYDDEWYQDRYWQDPDAFEYWYKQEREYAKRLPKYERKRYEQWLKAERKYWRERWKEEREYRKELRKAEEEYAKELRKAERERLKDQRKAEREYEKWLREVERGRRKAHRWP